MKTKVIGLYSFPKSGNTWVRHILTSALGQKNPKHAIPDIYKDSIWQNPIPLNGDKITIYKSHSKTEMTEAQGRKFKNNHVIYIVRHPLDVFLSQLNYLSDNVMKQAHTALPCQSVDDIISRDHMDLYFGAFCTFGTLQPEFHNAGSWLENTQYWTAQKKAEPNRITIIRYEDISTHGVMALAELSVKLGVSNDALSSGFNAAEESTKLDGRFFWKKKTKNYREMLPPMLIERFRRLFNEPLTTLGYYED